MRVRDLPTYPPLFVHFVENAWHGEPLLPGPPNIDAVLARARIIKQGRHPFPGELLRVLSRQAREFAAGPLSIRNIEILGGDGAVAVVTTLRYGLFGGPLSVLLKALSAIRLAAELQAKGISAVPVCWITKWGTTESDDISVNLLDLDLRLKNFSLGDDFSHSKDQRLPDQVGPLIDQIGRLAEGAQADEIIQILKKSHAPGTRLSTGMGRFLTTLFEAWGPVIVDSTEEGLRAFAGEVLSRPGKQLDRLRAGMHEEFVKLERSGYISFPEPETFDEAFLSPLLQEVMLPVAAHVADAAELPGFALIQPLLRETVLRDPVIWPHTGATILDARSRKILEKYSIRLEDLLSSHDPGKMALSQHEEACSRVVGQLQGMIADLDARLGEVAAFVASEGSIGSQVDSTHEKLKYQIVRLKERFIAGAQTRNDAVRRQVERICAILVPGKRMQQEGLGGLHFLLRYSRSILETLYNNLDVTRFEHQTIAVD